MSLDYAILGFLAERPRSGYDLKRQGFDGTMDDIWPADQAQIYRTLDRLGRSRLITSTRKRQSGRPDRRIYELTPEGRWALEGWLAEPVAAAVSRDPFHLQVFFGEATPDSALARLMEAKRAYHQTRLESLRDHAAAQAAAPDSDRGHVLKQTAFDGAIAVERATIDWLDDCIEAVNQGALPGVAEGIGQRHLFGT